MLTSLIQRVILCFNVLSAVSTCYPLFQRGILCFNVLSAVSQTNLRMHVDSFLSKIMQVNRTELSVDIHFVPT
jgi:hypothetical protein